MLVPINPTDRGQRARRLPWAKRTVREANIPAPPSRQRAELDQALENHRVWVETGGAAGVQLLRNHLGEASRGLDLRQANLRGADFDGADLRGVDLRGADLRAANLRQTKLGDARLRGADLRGADFTNADLKGMTVNPSTFRDANLADANLSGVKSLFAGQLAGAILTGATLPEDIADGFSTALDTIPKRPRTSENC